ncbi:hypothetical protein CDAR_164381 [Caerostris darwini]|uniref:Uncharacterized protein n=1 Tax=Caerostris darwini TaxID=1538125 RepID=A0AAV4UT42_9ARAC|nr:hypothetical protein CDAR_164381 [Caerostris darwini]
MKVINCIILGDNLKSRVVRDKIINDLLRNCIPLHYKKVKLSTVSISETARTILIAWNLKNICLFRKNRLIHPSKKSVIDPRPEQMTPLLSLDGHKLAPDLF